jgi:hypothetical protein
MRGRTKCPTCRADTLLPLNGVPWCMACGFRGQIENARARVRREPGLRAFTRGQRRALRRLAA